MATCVNLAKKKRAVLTVTLPDETTVILKSPTYELMSAFQTYLDSKDAADAAMVYDMAQSILDNNKTGDTFSIDYVHSMDFESIYDLVKAYADFCETEVMPAAKN